ncbi:MAG TPA: hypothetical protein VGP76_19595 [Planctomycetaceae bacterium]|jgi:hypothetical protein|nr:hypothetical protein [Planctomycetaceae bacterium]
MINLYHGHIPHWFVTCVSQSSLEAVDAWLAEMKFRCYRMRSSSVRDEATLLDAVLAAVGTTPSGSGLTDETRPPLLSWDGTSDFLFQELVARPDKQVAILWFEADQMLEAHLPLFLNALEWLRDFAEPLGQTNEDKNWFITVRVILLGHGSGFPKARLTEYRPEEHT